MEDVGLDHKYYIAEVADKFEAVNLLGSDP